MPPGDGLGGRFYRKCLYAAFLFLGWEGPLRLLEDRWQPHDHTNRRTIAL